MSKWHGGKGSTYKPYDKEKFDKNFEAIFGKKKRRKNASKTKSKSEDKR